jgi:hypothetical protein
MNNLLENVIAAIIFTALSTTTGLVIQIFGFSAQTSITVAIAVLFGLAVVFLVVRRYYPRYTRWRTERLLLKALSLKTHETDDARKA